MQTETLNNSVVVSPKVGSLVEMSFDDDIIHPSVKAVLNYLKVNTGLEIHHDGDLPARSGIGSSSSFTAGLLNAIHAMNGKMVSQYDLALYIYKDNISSLIHK